MEKEIITVQTLSDMNATSCNITILELCVGLNETQPN